MPVQKVKAIEELYQLGDKLGSGAFSVVRLGADVRSKARVAVKILTTEAYSTPAQREAARREVFILEQVQTLSNPNVLRFYGAFEDANRISFTPRLCLVTEICVGGELFDRIVARAHYSETDAAALLQKMATVLSQCHSIGIVHRDLKPENILYRSAADEEPVLADFGLALSASLPPEPPKPGFIGTYAYMSPEIIKHKLYSPACDVWALGVLLYILLCGYPPFYAETEGIEGRNAMFATICQGEFYFHEDFWSIISVEAKDLISAMLTVDPRHRITMASVLQHPWVQMLTAATLPTKHLPTTITKLREFNARRKIRAAAQAVVWGAGHLAVTRHLRELLSGSRLAATLFSAEELEGLSAAFHAEACAVDAARAGAAASVADVARSKKTVNFEQFKRVLQSVNLGDLPLERMFTLFDVDGSGDIEYRELLAGLARLSMIGAAEDAAAAATAASAASASSAAPAAAHSAADVEAGLRLCFNLFDSDNNGYITREELIRLLQVTGFIAPRAETHCGGSEPATAGGGEEAADPEAEALQLGVEQAALEAVFARIDADRDGKVTYEEFKAAVRADPALAAAVLRPLRKMDSRRVVPTSPAASSSSSSASSSAGSPGANETGGAAAPAPSS